MTREPENLAAAFPRTTNALIQVATVIVTGVLGTLVWLSLIQEGFEGRIFKRTWTDYDFAGGFGNALGSHEPSRTGLYISLGLGVAFALLLAPLLPRLPWQGWRKGLAFAPIIFVAWAALACPLVDARHVIRQDGTVEYLPNGFLGIDAGWGTVPSAIVASVATGIVMAHVLPIVRRRAWWERSESTGDGLGMSHDEKALLELTEQRTEQRVERPG